MFRALQLLYIIYSRQRFFYFVGKVKPTQRYFRFNAIYRTKKLTGETDELLVTGMELFFYFTNNKNIKINKNNLLS